MSKYAEKITILLNELSYGKILNTACRIAKIAPQTALKHMTDEQRQDYATYTQGNKDRAIRDRPMLRKIKVT